jgi:uncharacterized membrane protein YjjP (DUF1212 family)
MRSLSLPASEVMKILAWLLIDGCVSLLLSPNPFDALAAALLSLLIFNIVRKISTRSARQPISPILGALTVELPFPMLFSRPAKACEAGPIRSATV